MSRPASRVAVPLAVSSFAAGSAASPSRPDDAGYITGQQINVNGGWYL